YSTSNLFTNYRTSKSLLKAASSSFKTEIGGSILYKVAARKTLVLVSEICATLNATSLCGTCIVPLLICSALGTNGQLLLLPWSLVSYNAPTGRRSMAT